MAWWTKVDGKTEKHDGRRPKFAALIALNFARNLSGVPMERLGLYRKDPEKYPETENELPKMMQKETEKQIRAIMSGRRGRR